MPDLLFLSLIFFFFSFGTISLYHADFSLTYVVVVVFHFDLGFGIFIVLNYDAQWKIEVW